MELIKILEKSVNKQLNEAKEFMVTGCCGDFPAYRHMTGKIKAYEFVLEEISEVVKKAYNDEDEE
jgi:hypothetical protein